MSPPHFSVLPPLSLYIHLPWCVKKCPYCDFNSHQLRGELAEQAYVAGLLRDLDASLPGVQGREIQSIFMGGGTPSLFSAEAIGRLLTQLGRRLSIATDAEITLEANPGTVEVEKFRGFRDAGVNRLSLGIQSFNPRHLSTLGRIHDDREARRAVEIALSSFNSVNLDLMYVLPGQTPDEALDDVEAALGSGATHLSFYQLTIEANTEFAARPPMLPSEDEAAEIEEAVHGRLAAAGYRRYEVSAWAQAGSECRHNLNYWQFGDYLGIGAGAHGKLTTASAIVREVRTRAPADYLRRLADGDAIASCTEVSAGDAIFEFMLNALRLTPGISLRLLEERTGQDVVAAAPLITEAVRRGLLWREGERIGPTERGFQFLNDLTGMFLPDADGAGR